MKIYQRYFCYGSIFTSLAWGLMFYLYMRVQDEASLATNIHIPVLQSKNVHVKFQPRHSNVHAHHNENFDFVYGHESLEGEDNVINFKRQNVQFHDQNLNYDGNKKDLSELGIIKTPEDQKLRDEGDRLYAFNQLISDRIGMHRELPDTRNHLCKGQSFPSNLPKASIVICFYNEAWSALLRTVYSILDRTSPSLIHEILLVDDSSDHGYLKEQLDDYVKENLPLVKVLHTPSRHGLIRARIFGADHATGEVLVFLDSHCEVNIHWLEPLLARIATNRTLIPIPIIDIINHDTFVYESSPLVRGGFNWGMHYRWDNVPGYLLKEEADFIKPIRTPTMAGGLFAVDREYFTHLGKYDAGMNVWGGENLELSFRTWQCGGSLEIIPCSRVGHIFRKRRPYGSGRGDTMTVNSLRVVHVWMDEYKEYYYKVRPDAKNISPGDISERLALREKLQCKSFKWYLETIYPEQTLPDEVGGGGYAKGGKNLHTEPKVYKKGWLRHKSSGLCVTSESGPKVKKSLLVLQTCDEQNNDQLWFETQEYSLMLAGLLCLDVEGTHQFGGGEAFPRLMKCHFAGGSQQWKWTGQHSFLLNPGSGKCLSVSRSAQVGAYVAMDICNDASRENLKFELRMFL